MLNKERLIKLRESKGYTQEQLSSKLEIFQESYARWESGAIKNPRKKTLIKLADTLGTTVEYLTDTEILPLYRQLADDDKKKILEIVKELLDKKR